jgi:uncharacterized protein YbjT (DUF2867 family)
MRLALLNTDTVSKQPEPGKSVTSYLNGNIMSQTALIAGSTGLVGSALLQQLLESARYSKVVALVRRESGRKHPKLQELVVDFDQLAAYRTSWRADVIFSCLGSTRRKTPDKQQYYKIDHDYPLELARLGLQNGAQQFHLISSIGADARSGNFYLKMKGETEQALQQLAYPALHIYRPSVLTGHRKEQRWLEQMGIAVLGIMGGLLVGRLKKYRSIAAEEVACAMINCSRSSSEGVHIYESDQIRARAQKVLP